MKQLSKDNENFKKDIKKNKTKNTKKRSIWLLVWYLNSPPSVEYIANMLIIPRIKIETTKT